MASHDCTRFLRDDIDQLEHYTPVKPLDALATEIGVKVEDLVKLDANENLYGPLPQVVQAIDSSVFHIYPNPDQTELRESIAAFVGVSPQQIVAGAGSDELLDLVFRLVDPSVVINCTPTFGMYSFLGKIARVEVVEVPRKQHPHFHVDIAGIKKAVEARQTHRPALLFLASPNNPTGGVLSLEEIVHIAQIENLVFVVDEAYAEFSGSSAIPLISQFPNLIIMRTFSKWAALAGLRIGYMVAHPEIILRTMQIKQPYNIHVAADFAARAALQHRHIILTTQVTAIVQERDRMIRILQERYAEWMEPCPTHSNFVLVHIKSQIPFRQDGNESKSERTATAANYLALALRSRGVLVRYYKTERLANYVRFSAGRPQDTDKLLQVGNKNSNYYIVLPFLSPCIILILISLIATLEHKWITKINSKQKLSHSLLAIFLINFFFLSFIQWSYILLLIYYPSPPKNCIKFCIKGIR